ncbi:MAG: hypothetical protein ABIN36_06005 [Ferruginibacter sp.]
MKPLQALTFIFSFSILSCSNYKTDATVIDEKLKSDTVSIDISLNAKEKVSAAIYDSIKRFTVDDYPITNEMLADKESNNSSYKKQSGQTYSYDKAWFTNDSIKQTIMIELYTDYHRMLTYHFYNDDIPSGLIASMELHTKEGDTASRKQKEKDFAGFLKKAIEIKVSMFASNKGFKLGDFKKKAIDIYGKPKSQSMKEGIEKLDWEFVGEILYDGKSSLGGKPLAKDSYGHQITMYFRNGKLIAQILHNDIP